MKRNEDIVEDRGVESVENKIHKNKSNWLNHVSRMENTKTDDVSQTKMTSKTRRRR